MLPRGGHKPNVTVTCRETARRAFVLLIVAAITLSSTGWPAINWNPKSQVGTASAADRRDGIDADDSRNVRSMLVETAPRCCCAVNGHTRSCCCTAGAKPGKACCGVRKELAQNTPMARSQPAEPDLIPVFAPCKCGDGPDSDSISVGKPRIHSLGGHHVVLLRTADVPRVSIDHFQSVSQAPDTPPPRQAG